MKPHKIHPDGRRMTPSQKREIVAMFLERTSIIEIAKITGRAPATISDTITEYLEDRPKLIVHEAFRADITPVDYSQHDELSRHYAGAEYEDTRPPDERGLDWPLGQRR
jgi:transposase-like protein